MPIVVAKELKGNNAKAAASPDGRDVWGRATAMGGRWGRGVMTGLINGVVSIADGLATAALARVNPIAGLYASVVAPIAASALLSAQRMQTAATSASALAAGAAIRVYPEGQRMEALALLTAAMGVLLAAFALLRAGRPIKYVSQAMMTGSLTRVAVVLVRDQPAPLVDFHAPPGSEPVQFMALLAGLGSVHWPPLAIGALALGLAAAIVTAQPPARARRLRERLGSTMVR